MLFQLLLIEHREALAVLHSINAWLLNLERSLSSSWGFSPVKISCILLEYTSLTADFCFVHWVTIESCCILLKQLRLRIDIVLS